MWFICCTCVGNEMALLTDAFRFTCNWKLAAKIIYIINYLVLNQLSFYFIVTYLCSFSRQFCRFRFIFCNLLCRVNVEMKHVLICTTDESIYKKALLCLLLDCLSKLFVILIIKITISSLVIGLKMSYFRLIRLPSCYRTVCYWIVCYWTVCYWIVCYWTVCYWIVCYWTVCYWIVCYRTVFVNTCACARAVAFVFLPLTLEMFTPPLSVF